MALGQAQASAAAALIDHRPRDLHVIVRIQWILMPHPLDYRNPKAMDADLEPPKPVVSAAVPVEFDMILIRTEDHAAVSAIEAALAQEQISCFRSNDTNPARRAVTLYVRAADHDRAFQIAGEIFVRRHKLKSYPRQQV